MSHLRIPKDWTVQRSTPFFTKDNVPPALLTHHNTAEGVFVHVFVERRVQLTDILLMFIYLEVLAMVQQFVMNGKIPVRYPIYIAMMAIARYITLGMKELDATLIVWLSLAAFILAAATF